MENFCIYLEYFTKDYSSLNVALPPGHKTTLCSMPKWYADVEGHHIMTQNKNHPICWEKAQMEKTYKIYMISPRLIIIHINDKYMIKEIEKKNDKLKYHYLVSLFHKRLIGKENISSRTLMTTLKRI